MTDLVTLRCSALPMAFRCGGSVRPGSLKINESHDAANDGTAAHKCFEELVRSGFIDWDEVDSVAVSHGADPDQVRILCAQATKLWRTVAPHFVDALHEVSLSARVGTIELTGHVDLLAMTGTVARAADWKTGRKDSDYSQQMRGYGALILLENPDLTEVTVTVLWVRDESIENHTMTRGDLDTWYRRLTDVIDWDGTFRPGGHCRYCPRAHECAAPKALVRRDIEAITSSTRVIAANGDLGLLSPADLVMLHQRADLVSKYAEAVKGTIKRHVESNGEISDGQISLSITTEIRRELDPLRAWAVLEEAGFGDEDFAQCVTLGVSKVEKIVAKKAARGRGAAKVRELQAQLKEANAVGTREVRKLQAKRALTGINDGLLIMEADKELRQLSGNK